MMQTYCFFDGGEVEFDDRKSVKELIEFAFDTFDYYEPMGMEIVTLFQAHYPDSNTGWFTTDVTRLCAEEIKNPRELCFAYHMKNVFYFAEGGWGHHMPDLGNHPKIPHAVSLHLRFEDFRNTVIINGSYCFEDIIRVLQKTEYIDDSCRFIQVIPIGCADKSYLIPLSDPIMKLRLTELEKALDKYNAERLQLSKGDFISAVELRIC